MRSKILLCARLLYMYISHSLCEITVHPSRLKCLQHIHDLGRENITTESEQWIRRPTTLVSDKVAGAKNSTLETDMADVSSSRWVYNAPRCPLLDFDTREFCTQAIGCGKRVLLVGDSTLQAWMAALCLVLGPSHCSEQRHTQCPARYVPHCVTGRSPSSSSSSAASSSSSSSSFSSAASSRSLNQLGSQCDPSTHWGTNTLMHDMTVCAKACPTNSSGVQFTFIRHDFLNDIHGRRWYKDSVCHQWWEVAMQYDYLVLSFGPHLEAVLDNPYTSPHPHHVSPQDLFQETASAFTQRLAHLYQSSHSTKKPLLVYRSGPVGVGNYSRDCDEPPHDQVPDIVDSYEWPLIPLVNEIYIQSILNSFSTVPPPLSDSTPALIMDTSALMSKIKSCRIDFMHFKVDSLSSPVLLELQILFNLLSEYQHLSAVAAAAAGKDVSKDRDKKIFQGNNKNRIQDTRIISFNDNFALRNIYIVATIIIAVGGIRCTMKLLK